MSSATAQRPADPHRGLRRDAQRNYERILDAARQAFGESGADACMEEIAARAGVGVGTVYRRFASKDALIDELLRLATQELIRDAEHALARTDGYGLHELLRAFGRSFAEHARYANLLLRRQPDASAASKLRQAVSELTSRAVSAGTVNPGHHHGRRHHPGLRHARAYPHGPWRNPGRLAAIPRHPPGRHDRMPTGRSAGPCAPPWNKSGGGG